MGGITPSPGEESKLKQNGKSYKNQLLESEWNLVLIIFIDGLIPPMDTGLLFHRFEKVQVRISCPLSIV